MSEISRGEFCIFDDSQEVTRAQTGTDLLLQHCTLSALLDSKERMDPPRCHPNTRKAVLEEIMAWIEDTNPAGSIMILHGPVGSGKTALAQSIAERYKPQHWLAAAFFFSKTAPGRNNGHTLIPTIAFQLISSLPEVRLPIQMRLRREPALLKKPIQTVMDGLLIAPFFSWIFIGLCWITWAFGWVNPRLIVVDALDECADSQIQSHILRAAATATKRLQRSFRILITCRPEIHIMQTLQEPTINYVELDLGKHNASHDIQLFLRDKMEEIKQNHPLAKYGSFSSSWPGSDIISKITEKASGQFIYASLVVSFIESPKHSPVDRLNLILRSSPDPDCDDSFATLDALYTYIFSSVDDGFLMRQILGFIAIPRTADDGLGQYIMPAMIARLLSPVSISSIFLVLEQLQSVISSAGPDESIEFWHASIADFLFDEARSKELFVDIQMAHETLARGYLHLFQIQPPNHFMESPFFSLFLEHYKRALPSERLQDDLVAYDFFSAYKAAVGESISLPKLWNAWRSDRVRKLFRTLVLRPQGHIIVDVYVDGLYRSYPQEPRIINSLQSFIDSKKFEPIEAALHHTLYVPLLHGLLNCEDATFATGLAEKSVIGILQMVRFADSWVSAAPSSVSSSGWWAGPPWGHREFSDHPGFRNPGIPSSEFVMACNNCLSILLPHASHYSTELVNFLLEQQRETSPLPEIYVKSTMVGPYLEQFEDHVDAPPELKTFLEKYRGSKRPVDETADAINSTSSGDFDPQVST